MTKIVGVDVFPLALPSPDQAPRAYTTRPPWPSIYGNHRETLVVRLTADDGTAGWGEALAPVAPEVPAEIVHRLLAPVLLGADPRRVRPLRHQLGELMRERGHLGGHQADAIAAVDIALWDLAGKLAGLPVVDLLGGAFHREVPTYVSGLPGGADSERVAQARDWVGRGVRQVKVGLGYGVSADLATVSALREVHPDLRIAVDVHGVYGFADAVQLGRGLAERDAWFLEMPMAFEDVAGHADLAGRVDLPVALGESLRHRWEFQPFVAARAVGLLQPDIGRTGITEGLAIAQYAETHHLGVAPHHSAGLGLALAAGLHVAAACANLVAFEWHPTLFDTVNHILTVPIEVTPTAIPLPVGPGLGVSVDVDAVDRYCTWRQR
ncbi:mandelate racemase/muconate lactonizing enzyme family protein [Micromonospora sp. NPDC006431]|uniref:mandelate racemase/muconate lactonizing enzyme family protein n=1 Tax=Micromonospora sp. NPDC006431 TaxID=3364235 RepID=UPI0036BDB7F3